MFGFKPSYLPRIIKKNGYQQEQIDFVGFIEDKTKYSKKMYWKNSTDGFHVGLFSGNDVITHSFKKEPEDDFIKWIKTIIGNGASQTILQIKAMADLIRTGVWVDSTPTCYTAELGATFSASLYGSKLYFYHYSDNRGGVWRFVIDDGEPIDISTWASVGTYVKGIIMDGLNPSVEHTVVATFMGDDPLNPPTGGISRGWLSDDASYDTKRAVYSDLTGDTNYGILTTDSNRDFAFFAKYGVDANFIPAHSGVGSVVKIADPVYTVDNVVVDINTLAIGNPVDWENSITIAQHFYGTVNVTNVAEFWLTTTITKDGTIKTDGKMQALVDFMIGPVGLPRGYAPMLPLNNGVLETVVSSFGETRVNSKDGVSSTFDNAYDETISVCGVDETRTDLISAFAIDHIAFTNRQREQKSTSDILWANNDPSLYLKVYNDVFTPETNLATGYVYRWHTRHSTAKIDNAYSQVLNLFD